MKTLLFTRGALKSLRTVPRRDSQAILAKLKSFARGEEQDVVKLQGSEGYRLRHGDWRALFVLSENEITVAAIEHRREAYR